MKIFNIIIIIIILTINLYAKELLNDNHNSEDSNTIKDTKEIPVSLIIITNSTLLTKFQDFAKLKNREGIKTLVVTTATTGTTPQAIRLYLKNQKTSNPSLKYVLLGGDASIIPAYMIHNPIDFNTWDEYPDAWGLKFPSDFYYSNVLSDWNNNLSLLNYNIDLYVGRIPANTTTEAQNFITKYLNYRYNSDINYTKKFRLISNNYSREANYPLCDSLIFRVSRKLNYPITKQITTDNYLSSPTAITVGNILNEGNYSFLYTYTHGGENNSMACINSNVIYPPNQSNPDFTYMNLTTNYNYTINGNGQNPASIYRYLPNYLTNSQSKPFIFWLSSCGLSQFQKMSTTDPNTYIPSDCFTMELMNNNDGAVAVYSSSYKSSVGESFNNLSSYFDLLQANYDKKAAFLINEYYNGINHNFSDPSFIDIIYTFLSKIYFGDPSMDVWYKPSQSLTVKKNYIAGTSITVNVSYGSPFSNTLNGATVCILNNDDTIMLRGTTNTAGSITFNTTTDLSTKKISVCKDNFVPFYNTVSGTPQLSRPSQPVNEKAVNVNNLDISVKVLTSNNIMFNIASDTKSDYQIDIYNMKGQKINTILNNSDNYSWNGKNSNGHQIGSGIYLYKVKQNNCEKIGKFIIVK